MLAREIGTRASSASSQMQRGQDQLASAGSASQIAQAQAGRLVMGESVSGACVKARWEGVAQGCASVTPSTHHSATSQSNQLRERRQLHTQLHEQLQTQLQEQLQKQLPPQLQEQLPQRTQDLSMAIQMHRSSCEGAMWAAALATAFCGLLRGCEFGLQDGQVFDPTRHLTRADVKFKTTADVKFKTTVSHTW